MDRKIKVIHIITRMIIGGAQENTLYTVEGLHERDNFEVTLLTGPALGPEGDLLARGEKKGLDVRILKHMRRAINPVRDSIVLFQMIKLFKKERPDIVHTHSSKAGILGRIAAKIAKVPVIVHTIHGLPFHPYQNKFLNGVYVFLEKVCARMSDSILVVANAMRDKCLNEKIGKKSLYTRVWSGMETETFLNSDSKRDEIREDLGFSEKHLVIAKVARLFPLKGHTDLISSAEEICRNNEHVRFLLIGDGILREKLVKMISEKGLKDKFVFTGLVPPTEIPGLLAASDVIVHASYREGLARVLPQGLISGKPVVSYDVDGAGEAVEDNVNGRLIPAGDISALREGIKDVVDNFETYRQKTAASRNRVAEQFSVDKMVEDIIFCYLTFIGTTVQ